MEDKKETVNEEYIRTAVIGLDTATTSEDEAKREDFKKDLIECYKEDPEFRAAVDSAYAVKKRKFEEQGKTVEYGRLMEIGRILGIEKEQKIEEESSFERKSVSKKENNNSIEELSSCSEEFDKQFGCRNSTKCCLIA